MAILLTIVESTQETVVNVPKWITVSSDIPATVFYTFDGTIPNEGSDVYLGRLSLPTDQNPLVVKIWATNGSDSSDIEVKEYSSTLVGARLARADAVNYGTLSIVDFQPFSSSAQPNPPIYGPQVGITVNDLAIPGYPDGYDGSGNQVFNIDLPKSDYTFIYSETDRLGQTGRGIGTLPSTTTIRYPEPPPETSSTNDKFFNPKALVIYQDSRDTENTDLTLLNKTNFDSNDPSKSQISAYYYSARDGNKIHGSAGRPHFNQKDQTITFFYHDSLSGRRIISTEPFRSKHQDPPSNILIGGRQKGAGYVFPHYPFLRKNII